MHATCIDVHAHALPASFLSALTALGTSTFSEDGFPEPSWAEEEHVAFARKAHAFHVLSISSPHIGRDDDGAAAELVRKVNDETAELCRRHPDDFGFFGLLPLPAIDATIDEIGRTIDELGALGVKVPSNARGIYLGDPRLDPVLEAMDARSCVVAIHPCAPQTVPQGVFTAGPRPLFEFLADTTRLIINLITTDALDRFPNIRWIVPHAGSFIPEVAHRLQGLTEIFAERGLMDRIDVLDGLRRLYFDTAGTALPVMLPALLEVADPTHILYGSDYPYTPARQAQRYQHELISFLDEHNMTKEVLFDNAARLLHLA